MHSNDLSRRSVESRDLSLCQAPLPRLDLSWIHALPVDQLTKGIPVTDGPLRHAEIKDKGWNQLRHDLPFPVAVIREDIMADNRAWMRRFLEQSGVELCPHGKTTMSPELFDLQIADGAFGITCATASQLEVYRRAGVQRVILANQLIGRTNTAMALRHLRDQTFELYCLVDSHAGLELLAATARQLDLDRPVKVLLELGADSARTGQRTLAGVMELAQAAIDMPELAIVGLEIYEGVFSSPSLEEREVHVRRLLEHAAEVASALSAFVGDVGEPFVLSAGGSDFFDLVMDTFRSERIGRDVRVILRGGCYLTHDSLHYARCFERMRMRSPATRSIPGELRAALEVWSTVQSRPEPLLAHCALGKRDISYDWELPRATWWQGRGSEIAPQVAPEHWRTKALNDQHLHLTIQEGDDLRVGDLVAFGVSHPCTTFDKWRNVFLVDPDYNVVGAIRTFF